MMNRLILIGNGFDLAHGLKTDYNSFILWYIKKCLVTALKKSMVNSNYTDEILTVHCDDPFFTFGNISGEEGTKQMVDHYYIAGLRHLFKDDYLYMRQGYAYLNPFKVAIKSVLLSKLIDKCSNANW